MQEKREGAGEGGGKERNEQDEIQSVKGVAYISAFIFLGHNEQRFKPDVVLVTRSSREWSCAVIIPH